MMDANMIVQAVEHVTLYMHAYMCNTNNYIAVRKKQGLNYLTWKCL